MQNKIVSALFLFLLFTFQLKAQLFPKEGSKLNYRLIGFSFPAENKISKYKIELASGMHNTEDSFAKNIIKSLDCETNKLVAEVPSFGMEYTWRVVNKNNTENNSRLHHFSTGIIPEADTHITRLRIAKNADKYEDAYVFLDGNKALYDMNGNPVWYLPEIEGSNATPADIK